MLSRVNDADHNYCYLFINGERLDETSHFTYTGSGTVMRSTGGRVLTLEASARDKIEVRTGRVDGSYGYILYCAEYIPKM